MMQELAANGNNFVSLCAPGTLNQSLQITLPAGTPSAGQVLALGAPSGGISSASYNTAVTQVQGNATNLTQRATLNFTGVGIACADDAAQNRTDCSVSPGLGIDPTTVSLFDEFLPGTANIGGTSALYGQLGWTLVGAGAIAAQRPSGAGAIPPGLLECDAANAANSACVYHLGGVGFGSPFFYDAAATTNWEFQFTAKADPSLTSQTIWRVGLVDSTNQLSANGLWMRYASNSGCTETGADTGWVYEARNAGTSTTVNSPVSVTAGHSYRMRIRSTARGTILFSISDNGGAFTAETGVTTNLPTTALAPAFEVVSCDTNVHKITADRFDYIQTGLVR